MYIMVWSLSPERLSGGWLIFNIPDHLVTTIEPMRRLVISMVVDQ